jgi:hypothetical protein
MKSIATGIRTFLLGYGAALQSGYGRADVEEDGVIVRFGRRNNP